MISKRKIGEALDRLVDDVAAHTLELVAQARATRAAPVRESMIRYSLLRQAVDTPHRARVQLQGWIDRFDTRRGGGVTFLQQSLAASGSGQTLAQINAALAALEDQLAPIASARIAGTLSWEAVADAIEAAFGDGADEPLDYRTLPLPDDYKTVLGETY